MTTLVHTSPEGPAGQQISLLTATTRARSLVQTLDSTLVDNASLVAGATVTAALNNLSTTIGALNSNQVLNASGVAGVTVTDALNAIRAALVGSIVQTLGWNGGAVLTMQVVPAGHPAGLYQIDCELIVRALPGAGTLTKQYNYTSSAGATNTPISASGALTLGRLQNPGSYFYNTAAVRSTGATAIDAVVTPVGITGAPSFDVSVYARLVAQ